MASRVHHARQAPIAGVVHARRGQPSTRSRDRDRAIEPVSTRRDHALSHAFACTPVRAPRSAREPAVDDHANSQALIELPLRGVVHPVAASLAQPGTRFRVPEFERVKSAYTDQKLKIPEDVVKARVTQLLERMEKEGRLKSSDPVATIVAKIFPAPGTIDEAEFNKAIDVTDRKSIYKDVFDANTKVKSADKPKLAQAMKDAGDLVKKAESDSTGLTEVFGGESANAKTNYGKARRALNRARGNMSKHLSTDYNLDDPEVGLGGWANFGSQHIHLLLEVVKVTDEKRSKITLIHEACHLANPIVDDQGYYGSPGFEALSEAEKVGNAAHYEEIPRRELGISSFAGKTFTPGVLASGSAPTREDDVRRLASEFMRKAWDAAVDVHTFFRDLRIAYLNGSKSPFRTNKTVILELSKLMDLTIHEQAGTLNIVTTLDVTLSESIARGVRLARGELASVPFPSAVGALTDQELRDQMVDAAVARYGNLLKDAARDRKLLEWFESHYRNVPSV